MPEIQPFPFEQLPQYSLKQVELINRLVKAFPARGIEMAGIQALKDYLSPYLRLPLTVCYESIFETQYGRFVGNLPEPFVCVGLTVVPLTQKVLMEVDLKLCFALIDHMLGGAGRTNQLRPLTILEQGLIQFLVVKCLGLLENKQLMALPSLRFDKLYGTREGVRILRSDEEDVILVTFRVRFGEIHGYIRLALPTHLIADLQGEPSCFVVEHGDYRERRLQVMSHLHSLIWAEVGHVMLSPSELVALERGDIILLDDAHPQLQAGKLSGRVWLRLGDGEGGGLWGNIEADGSRVNVRVDEVFIGGA